MQSGKPLLPKNHLPMRTNPIKNSLKTDPKKINHFYVKIQELAKRYPSIATSFRLFLFANIFSCFLMAGFSFAVQKGFFGKLPKIEELNNIKQPIASEVYTVDSILLGRYFIQNRSEVSFDDISPNFINALIATEDVRFYKHRGVDLRSWFRVFFKTLIFNCDASGGGSTLSQQLAKNLYPRKNYEHLSLFINKLKEIFIAIRIEEAFSKKQVLELYLNTVPFSENTYGLKVASEKFFNKQPINLKVEEAAILVAMLKATSIYNPMRNAESALQRRNIVLRQMAKYGYLENSSLDSILQLPITLDYRRLDHNDGLATYFREHLRLELNRLLKNQQREDGRFYNLYTDGLKIYTTLDNSIQQYGEDAVAQHLDSLQKEFDNHLKGRTPWDNEIALDMAIRQSDRYKVLKLKGLTEIAIDSIFSIPVEMTLFSGKGKEEKKVLSPLDSVKYYLGILNAGFLAIEPSTGKVKAWVGGINHKYFKYDHVKSHRQAGSTFKPLVYTAAIRKGIPPCQYIPNHLVTYSKYENWRPKNAEGKYGGAYSMEGGLSRSVNAVTINLLMRTGSRAIKELAEKMGITSKMHAVPSIGLGAVDVSLFDMVKVFGTYANRGKRPDLQYISRIETNDGKVIVNMEKECYDFEQVITEEEADMLTKMMRSTVNYGTAIRLRYRYKFEMELAGKTGTSQKHADGWFIGYTPDLVAGVWVGADSPTVHFRNLKLGQGANTALPVYALFLQKLLSDEKFCEMQNVKFERPSSMVRMAMNCPSCVGTNPEEIQTLEKRFANLTSTNTSRPLLPKFTSLSSKKNELKKFIKPQKVQIKNSQESSLPSEVGSSTEGIKEEIYNKKSNQ